MATVQVQFGGKGGRTYSLETNQDLVAIRTYDKAPVQDSRLSGASRKLLDTLEPVSRFPDAGVEVFHVRSGSARERDAVRSALKAEPSIRFAGRVLADPVFRPATGVRAATAAPTRKEPVLYSENLFVKFASTQSAASARRTLASHNLKTKREVEYLPNAWFAQAPEGIGLGVFPLALDLLRNVPGVEFCHPELLRKRQFRAAFKQEWHLKRTKVGRSVIDAHAHVAAAWRMSRGKGITIAVIDTGIDIDHEEFASRGKIVFPHDATEEVPDADDPRPRLSDEEHGTCCAGVACADGRKKASGVAPLAKLLPIRLMSGLGSQGEADAFAWAADHGADVISCSWGPEDGKWWQPRARAHRAVVPLPDNTRLAIDYALTTGRRGKGCVICWAAGNGNELVENDGYASYPGVIAVAACNDTSKRSVYSDTGAAIWCAFPSDDDEMNAVATPPAASQGGVWNMDHPAPKTPGIWTTDWSGGPGYNPGGTSDGGDTAGDYTNSFGGTSSATPGVAGVAALVLALNRRLRNTEVRDILKRACDQIDRPNGRYDAATGHSPLYGYGRVNALKAVKLAVAKPIRKAKRSPSRKSKTRPRKARTKR